MIHTCEPWKPNAGSLAKSTNCGIMVTTPGSIMVARTSANIVSRPRQRSRANEYATSAEERAMPITPATVMMTVFMVHCGHMPKLNASR